jgi:hypothetical protein
MKPLQKKKKGIEITQWKVEDDDGYQSVVIHQDPDIEVSADHRNPETS